MSHAHRLAQRPLGDAIKTITKPHRQVLEEVFGAQAKRIQQVKPK